MCEMLKVHQQLLGQGVTIETNTILKYRQKFGIKVLKPRYRDCEKFCITFILCHALLLVDLQKNKWQHQLYKERRQLQTISLLLYHL